MPAYPTKLAALEDPNLLLRHVPIAWLGRREIVGAIGMLLAANTAGCSRDAGNSQTPTLADNEPTPTAAVAAPEFLHGTGLGWGEFFVLSAGGPPVSVSEEDARRLIRVRLAEAGLRIDIEDHTLSNITIRGNEYRHGHNWLDGTTGHYMVSYAAPLVVDLYDPKTRVGIEYVSEDDYYTLGGTAAPSEPWRDHRDVADGLSRVVTGQNEPIYFGVFYDPLPPRRLEYTLPMDEPEQNARSDTFDDLEDLQEWLEAQEEVGEDESEGERLLRRQVEDFIGWLKGQGVI